VLDDNVVYSLLLSRRRSLLLMLLGPDVLILSAVDGDAMRAMTSMTRRLLLLLL